MIMMTSIKMYQNNCDNDRHVPGNGITKLQQALKFNLAQIFGCPSLSLSLAYIFTKLAEVENAENLSWKFQCYLL